MAFDHRNFFNADPEYTEFCTDVKGIYILINTSELKAICFHSAKKKYTWHYIFANTEQMLLTIDKAIKLQFDKNVAKETLKIQKAKQAKINRAKVQIGDIFNTSWGYDQTNVEFFQVIERISPTRVKVKQIRKLMEEEQYMSAQVKPAVDCFYDESEKTCTIRYDGNLTNADVFGNTAYATTATASHYSSWYA